ncbi:MAG: MOSC domain-containing protein [Pseudomonadota bacterium]
MTFKIISINISKKKGEKKKPVASAILLEGVGIAGDAHAGFKHRQVSLLATESIAKITKLGLNAGPGDFAENITTEGIGLSSLPIGTKIQLGDCILLEVTQIGKECHDRCAIFKQVGDCVMPREGIFARVLEGGMLNIGDIGKVLSCHCEQSEAIP